MCEIVYNILITNFTVHRCIIRSNAPSNLQMQPLGCIFVYALNCITFGTAIDPAVASGPLITTVNDLVAVVTYYGMSWILLLNVLKLV
jgi:cation transporter-like permease